METKFTVKRIVLCCIAFTMGLTTLLTLCLPLLQVKDSILESFIAYVHKDVRTFESGFTLLDLEGSSTIYKESAVAVGVVSWIQLVLSIETMIISVVLLCIPSEKIVNIVLSVQMAICIAFIASYMILGITYINSYYEYFCIFEDGTFTFTDKKYASGNTYKGTPLYTMQTQTLAYIGLIIGMILLIAYIVCSITLKGRNEKTSTMHKSDNSDLANNVAKALKQYKELLDSGIITQEEFEKKKHEILNL